MGVVSLRVSDRILSGLSGVGLFPVNVYVSGSAVFCSEYAYSSTITVCTENGFRLFAVYFVLL